MDRNKELKVHRLRLPGRSLCSIRSNRKWCKRRGSSLQCQNCFFVYPIIDCNLKNFYTISAFSFFFLINYVHTIKKSRYSFSNLSNHGISPFRLLILYLLSFLIFINNLSYYVHFSTQTAYCPEYLKAYHSKIYCRFHKIQ